MIRLQTLGSLDLRASDGHEIRSILAQPKRLALLVYLAVQGRRGFLGRDQILALFWPEQDNKQARGALNRALYYLRSSLGEGVLLSRGDDAIGFAADALWCDATELEAAAAEGRHQQVLELYGGDLLEGFNLVDTVELGRWLEAKRARLREVACRSAWSLAEAERQSGNTELTIGWARWAVQRSPYDEASVRRLIALLDESGDRSGAVHEYELFESRLAVDLEVSPAPETVALVDSIRARSGVEEEAAPAHVHRNGVIERTDDTDRAAVVGSEGEQAAAEVSQPSLAPGLAVPRARLGLFRVPRWRRALTAATAVLGLGTLLVFQTLRPVPDPRLVLVESIENRTDDPIYDALARNATERIVRSVSDVVESPTAMAPFPTGRVIRRGGRVAEARVFGRGRSAGTVVSGEIVREAGALQFRVQVVDAVRGGGVWAIPPITVSRIAIEEVEREVSQRVTGAVAALRDPRIGNWFPAVTSPPTYEGLVEYRRVFDVQRPWESGEHYARAAEIDSTFTWALLEASAPVVMLDRERAHEIVTDLARKRDRLSHLQSVVLDARIALEAGDRVATYEAMRVAAGLAPARFLRDLAASAQDLHLTRETLQILEMLDARSPTARIPPTWASQAALLHELGDYRGQLDLVERARMVAPSSARLYAMQIPALAALGQGPKVLALVDSAVSLPIETMMSPGDVMMIAAQELRAHGNPAAFEEMVGRAIDWYRSSPASFTKANPEWHESRLADALYLDGRWDEARALYEKLLQTNPDWRCHYYAQLGALAARRGDRAEAERYIELLGTLSIPTEAEAYDIGLSRAAIAVQLGDADRALAYLIEGYGGGQGVDLHTDFDFEDVIRTHRGFQEFVRPKG